MAADSILAEVARATWHDAYNGEPCPDHAIPTDANLCAWWRPADASDPAHREACKRLDAVLAGRPFHGVTLGAGWEWTAFRACITFEPIPDAMPEPPPHVLSPDGDTYFAAALRSRGFADGHPGPGDYFAAIDIVAVHERWLAIPEAKQPRHPLAPVVLAWQRRPEDIEPDRRETAILPESLRTARIAAYVDGLDPQLPLTLTGGEVGEVGAAPVQGRLFEFEAPASALVPILPLRFYRDAGGLGRTRRRGAPTAKRIWWSAVANTDTAFRKPDGSVRLTTTLRDLNAWLYPGRRWHSKQLDVVRRGLWEADGIRVEWERREWRIVGVDAFPNESTKLDDLLPLRVAMPPGSSVGALISKQMLYEAGTVSGPVLDAYIRLAYLWDAAKVKTGGRRIYATRPKVLRDARGRLVDAARQPIIGPDPVLPWQERRKVPSDKPAQSWSDSRAVVIGTERSPAADHVPVLDRHDLVRLFHGDVAVDGQRLRKLVFESRRMLRDHFETPGHVVLEHHGEGVRILEAWRVTSGR